MKSSAQDHLSRRPIKTRGKIIFHRLAKGLVAIGLTPNLVSVLSVAFSLLAAGAFWQAGQNHQISFLILALVAVNTRLLCNMIDGLMAVECGKKSKLGELYNDVPDRFADILIILGMAASAGQWHWGWAASILAVLTAYVRMLGASLGTKHYFLGPQAKQHRMFIVNLAGLFSMLEISQGGYGRSIHIGLIFITLGAALTFVRRLLAIARELNAK